METLPSAPSRYTEVEPSEISFLGCKKTTSSEKKVKIIHKCDTVDDLTIFLINIPECQNIFNRFVRIILEDGTSGG